MPVYNAERYVAQAVESILAQTYSRFEFLIIDDGSSDRSLSILQRYARQDARIRLISRPNTGYVIALNEMLSLAQGEFIARMDADDVALPNRFQRQVDFMQQHPEVVCVGSWHTLIDHRGRLLTCLELPQQDSEIQREALAGHGSICHPCALIRRSVLSTLGGYNPELMPAEDLDLWLRLGEVGQLANIPEPLLHYRLHPHSISETAGNLQRQQARTACERAWQRRGMEGTFEANSLWRPGTSRSSRHQFMLQYGWWAFNSQQRRTAAIYGLKAIALLPWRREGWTLLGVSVLKPRSREVATQ